ncbi:RNA-binding domain-containing protein [Wilcoxina mikolae CBS 423.85]|nr:RNA-binding domain-containing protein [Wilcoxina mikolae CBS 423.85]
MSAIPPNQTLYIQNLNDKIRKPDLRISLYTLFSTYGVVLDVVALKTMKHRGQAHIAFRDVASATQAMRALDGMNIFGKDMKISYAKGKSHKIAKLDGTFRMPNAGGPVDDAAAGGAKPFVPLPGTLATPPAPAAATASPAAEAHAGQKRQREEESVMPGIWADIVDAIIEEDSGAEMEMEDDDD